MLLRIRIFFRNFVAEMNFPPRVMGMEIFNCLNISAMRAEACGFGSSPADCRT